jgi:hypothetical protein
VNGINGAVEFNEDCGLDTPSDGQLSERPIQLLHAGTPVIATSACG